MKTRILIIVMLALMGLSGSATNVSGGIYANTTWTFVNSPYIVTDNVVVFPGVTLTIEAGVVVKFDSAKYIEIRQANFIAIGTALDSITFTSNNATPTPGIWDKLWFNSYNTHNMHKLNYCNFKYANTGINIVSQLTSDTLIIKHTTFDSNVNGIYGGNAAYVFVDTSNFINNTNYGYGMINQIFQGVLNNCNFSNNNTGVIAHSTYYHTFNYCTMEANQIGFSGSYNKLNNCIIKNNQNGILGGNINVIKNCSIDSNSVVGVHLDAHDSLINCSVKYNGIGLDDPSHSTYVAYISKNVFENDSIGIRLGAPFDHIYCNKICNNTTWDVQYTVASGGNANLTNNYWNSTDSVTIDSHIYDGYDNINLGLILLAPLDTVGCYLTGCNLQLTTHIVNATCHTCANGSAGVTIANGFAPYTYTWNTSPIQTTQTAVNLLPGTYTVCVIDGNGCTACHAVTVDSTNCSTFAIGTTASNATCATCLDGTATVVATGGTTPYSYSWYTAPMQSTATATGLLHGTYQVCVSDAGGCLLCDSATVNTGNCSAHFNLFPDTAVQHHYFAVNMVSGVSPFTYDWNWGDNGPHDFTAFPSHQYASAGAYNICLSITDFVGCTSTYCNNFYLLRTTNTMVSVNVVNANFNTGINTGSTLNKCSILPNPFSTEATLILEGSYHNPSLFIYNLMGQEVRSIAIGTNQEIIIQRGNLPAGMYFYKVVAADGMIGTGKLVIED